MPTLINDNDFQQLKQSLPTVLAEQCDNDESHLRQAYPLLNMICKNRDQVKQLAIALKIPEPLTNQELAKQLSPICDVLAKHFNPDALIKYRLPIVLGEFPIHSRVINKAIAEFNALIEIHHQLPCTLLPGSSLEACYQHVLTAIKERGSHCDPDSLLQILSMLSGWSTTNAADIFKKEEPKPIALSNAAPTPPLETTPVIIQEVTQPKPTDTQNPFVSDYHYNYNGSGRLAAETDYLLHNAFGMKFAGHFDALVKYPPHFIPLEQLHAIIRRQLSHRLDVWPSINLQILLNETLYGLGVSFIPKNNFSNDVLVNPFLNEPISFLTPEKIHKLLEEKLVELKDDDFNPNAAEIDILSQYLYELLQGFQINPGQALGIGANWDGTVNLSNEAGSNAFKFKESEAAWGRRFKQLSLHRQGPSEAYMNAAIGVKVEFQAFFSSFEYMSQLQPSEHSSVVYNALIDNLVADLFPDPAYFQNTDYAKYNKQHTVKRNAEGAIEVEEFLVPNENGTYFKDKAGHEKQTPKYRQAGTLDVRDFPKNTTYSEQSRVCYEGNPLGAMQLQYAQSMCKSTRGHIVYDPIAPDQFLEDSFYGQVIRSDNGDYLPFIGVIPKNFDKHFKQEKELCASFVIRMLQSARIMEHCPTFKAVCDQIKTRFLPDPAHKPPVLPKFCSNYLQETQQRFIASLMKKDRQFNECQTIFYSLFKNTVYNLYDLGKEDEHFKRNFLSLFNGFDVFYPINKAKCEKLLRDLTVNRPVHVDADSLARYDETLHYLRELTQYFYPKPSDDLAKEIAKQARMHVQPLLRSQNIKAYFSDQKQNRQNNLSKQQSPGMFYAELKHGGPSKTVSNDYDTMHDVNFISHYHDSDGTPMGKPQPFDTGIDWLAKRVGTVAQLVHKYNLFAVIRRPFSETYIHAKQNAVKHRGDPLQALWIMQGALKGLFVHGIAIGIWQTATTPFHMLYDFFSWQLDLSTDSSSEARDNPLALPAAPANFPSMKTRAAARSRDFLLHLLASPGAERDKNDTLHVYMTQLLIRVYPTLSDEEVAICILKFNEDFPLDATNWEKLFKPLLSVDENPDLAPILQQYTAYINRNIIRAVFRCITHSSFAEQSGKVIKESSSFHSLDAKQNEAIKKILAVYQKTPKQQQSAFIELFRFNGTLEKQLKLRDSLVQQVQQYILQIFDRQLILELSFDAQIEQVTEQLTVANLDTVILRVPAKLKEPLHLLLENNDLAFIHNYDLSEKQYTFLTRFLELYNQMEDGNLKNKLFELSQPLNPHDKIQKEKRFSVKEKAQSKWAESAIRELNNELLDLAAFNTVCSRLRDKVPSSKALVEQLKPSYQALSVDDDASIDLFYGQVNKILNPLQQKIASKTPIQAAPYIEAHTLLKNFRDVTMNALVNSRIAKVDIFAEKAPVNPLINSNAISRWLQEVKKVNRDLRSLLDQQLQQAPSIDHSLWRSKCILQVLEKTLPGAKVRGTGMQSQLRFWSKHRDSVTNTGEQFIDPILHESKKRLDPSRLTDSDTLKHAMDRVKVKLG